VRQEAVEELIRVTAPNGILVLELPNDAAFAAALASCQAAFNNVRVRYFKNGISRAYEHLFERNGFLGSHPIASRLPMRLVAGFLSLGEFGLSRIKGANAHAVIIATIKKSQSANEFDEAKLKLISSALYATSGSSATQTVSTSSLRALLLVTRGTVGGAQMSVSLLAEQLAKNGATVMVGSGNGEFLPGRLVGTNVKFQRFHHLKRSINPFTSLRFIVELYRFLKQNPVDALHLNSTNTLFGAIAARLVHPRPHIVFTFRGLSLLSPSHGNFITRFAAKLVFKVLLRFVHTTVFVSNTDFEEAKRLGLNKNGRVIHNGLNPDALIFEGRDEARLQLAALAQVKELPRRVLIGSVGRMSYQKNYQLLINAFAHVHKTNPQAHVVIIGDGPERQACHELIKRLELTQFVHIVGELPNASRYITAFDVFVLPSRFEGLSLTLLETLFAGIPVVATDNGGNREVLGDAAWYFTNNNAPALSVQLTAALTDTQRRDAIASGAKARAPQFLIEKTASRYAELFKTPRL
jgi:glycosyltransferase involved in cell wall biosynthesis